MNSVLNQGSSATLAAVIDDRNADAIAIFFDDNRLIHHLIRKYGGWNLSDEMHEQIYDEVCVQILKARPRSYDPSYAPGTYLKYPVLEASRTVKREQFAGGVTNIADNPILLDQFEDDAPVDECGLQTNVGMLSIDLERRVDAKKLLGMMPTDLAEVLLLEHWYGLSFKQACAKIGIERTSAYRKMRQFKAQLN